NQQRYRHTSSDVSCCLTPRGKLRACPCAGPEALLYEPRPSTAQQPSTPDSFTGYVRQPRALRRVWAEAVGDGSQVANRAGHMPKDQWCLVMREERVGMSERPFIPDRVESIQRGNG